MPTDATTDTLPHGLTPTMGRLIDDFDWSRTPLGSRDSWLPALTNTVRLMVASRVPMALLVGPDGHLIYNDGYAPICGRKHPACLGQSIVDVWPEASGFNTDIISRVAAGEAPSFKDIHFTLERNGAPEEVWFDLDYSPVLHDDGSIIATLAIVSETTERKAALKALAESQGRLSLALGASGIVGTWDWRIPENRVFADQRLAEFYGLSAEAAARGVSLEDYAAAIHPEDRTRVVAAIEKAITGGNHFSEEYRLINQSGDVRWVLAEGKPSYDANGVCIRFPGVAVDITPQREAIEARSRSEAAFRTLADAMPQMVWSTRPDGYHDYYNARWYEFTGVPQGTTDGVGWNDILHAEDRDQASAVWQHSLATGEPYQIEYRLRHNSSTYRWVLARALPIRDEAGAISRWYGTCTDIHDARIAAAEREVVAHELSHRIKNIFSVLSGLISLSARSMPEARPFAERLRQRIEAMGRAHDFVRPHSHTSRPEPIDTTFFGLLGQLLQPYESEDSTRISIQGDDSLIGDSAATPIALLLHELATNSAKYGSLSSPEGRLAILGSIQGEDYRIEWRESGGPAVDRPPTQKGFGSRLMQISVEGQMGGRIEHAWQPDGLQVSVAIPLAALQRSGRLTSAHGA